MPTNDDFHRELWREFRVEQGPATPRQQEEGWREFCRRRGVDPDNPQPPRPRRGRPPKTASQA